VNQKQAWRKALGENIRRRREELGLTQPKFARMIGAYDGPQISSWETGRVEPVAYLGKLEEAGVEIPSLPDAEPTLEERVARIELILSERRDRRSTDADPEAMEELEASRRGSPPSSPRANLSGRRDAPS
jgi:transcriptional regulator with XRE-family HTH domain